MSGPNIDSPLKEIKDSVQGIVLGPNRTSNNGRILDANDIDPETAGTQFHKAALDRLQAESSNAIAQVRQESATQIAGLTNQITQLTTAIQNQSTNNQQLDPLPTLTDEEATQIEPIRGAVDKLSGNAVEIAKREMLATTQHLIDQNNAAYDARVKQLEEQLATSKVENKKRFDNDLLALGSEMGINVGSLQSNANWNNFIMQPVSPLQPDVRIQDVLAQTSKTQDLNVWRNVFQQFSQMYGGNRVNTGLANQNQNQNHNQQFNDNQGTSTLPANADPSIGGGGGGRNSAFTGGQGNNAVLEEIDRAHQQINVARQDLHRQLHEERSISRETYTEQMAEIIQMEADLYRKRNELTKQAG